MIMNDDDYDIIFIIYLDSMKWAKVSHNICSEKKTKYC